MNEVIEKLMERYGPKSRAEREQAIREILQELILAGLWRGKFFEHAAFYGGTALRILHGLDRFSEDLDFTLTSSKSFEWTRYTSPVISELRGYGFDVEMKEKLKSQKSAIKSAFLKTNTIEALLKVGTDNANLRELHPEATIQIRVEIDTDPIPGLRYETVYMKEPLPRPIQIVTKPDLFAGKLHAAFFRAWKGRVKGRDWWDIVWFIRKDTSLNLRYLTKCMQFDGELSKNTELTKNLLLEIAKERIGKLNIKLAQEDVRPFLRDSTLVDDWSPEYFMYWLNKIHEEK